MIVVRHNLDVLDRQPRRRGSSAGDDGSRSPCAICPLREQIDVPVREQLIVELYSK